MATFTKLSENEMNYYQFKAKQILLQKKEEKEWQDFCKLNASDCAACSDEKASIKESKDVGIQTFPKKPILKTDRVSLQPKCKKEENPEALINIMTRLKKIDLTLSKLFDESHKGEKDAQQYGKAKNCPAGNMPGLVKHIQQYDYHFKSPIQERSPMTLSTFTRQQILKPSEEQRKLEIQNNFKTSLKNSTFVVHKKSSEIRPRNTGFFLPHELEVKRAAARKAYLASLQTKPKVSLQSKKQCGIENVKSNQSKKNNTTRKKKLLRKGNLRPTEDNEETLIKGFVTDDSKDKNIEGVVEAILEDLLGEAALDLNKIRQNKGKDYSNTHKNVSNKAKKSSFTNPPNSSPMKCNSSKIAANDSNSIMRLKSFIDSSEVTDKENNLRRKQLEFVDKSTSTSKIEDTKAVYAKKTTLASGFQEKQDFLQTVPKFVCGVTNIIKIDPERAKDISSKRDRFWKYLENTSQIPKGNFNPWILNESLAESILEDCISDIAEELSEMPSSIICDLYNQEFVQQVEI